MRCHRHDLKMAFSDARLCNFAIVDPFARKICHVEVESRI